MRGTFRNLLVYRRSWAERSVCGDISFDLEKAAREIDNACLKEARARYDAAKAKYPKGFAKGDGKNSSGGKGNMGEKICFK